MIQTPIPLTPKKPRKPAPRRAGKFRVSREIISDWPSTLRIMRHFVVFRIDWDYLSDTGTYCAYSKLFDVVDEGAELPDYHIILNKNGRKLTISAERQK